MRKTGMYGLDLCNYIESLGYEFYSLRECVDIIQRDHIDISEFMLPKEFKTFEAYADDVREDDEEQKRFLATFNRKEYLKGKDVMR